MVKGEARGLQLLPALLPSCYFGQGCRVLVHDCLGTVTPAPLQPAVQKLLPNEVLLLSSPYTALLEHTHSLPRGPVGKVAVGKILLVIITGSDQAGPDPPWRRFRPSVRDLLHFRSTNA